MHAITEKRVRPSPLADEFLGVRVEQEFVRIEPVAVLRLVSAVSAETVDRAGMSAGEVAVPDFIGAFGEFEARELFAAGCVEETDFDLLRVRGEDGEVDAQTVPVCSERVGRARE